MGIYVSKKDLNITNVDVGVALTKSVVGAIPFAGTAASELLSSIIPNQRLDRVTDFILELDKRINKTEQELLKENKYFVDLFEDAILQATRSLTEERNKFIAVFLEKNKNVTEFDFNINKKLLRILEELTDRDIEILKSFRDKWYSMTYQKYCIPQQTIGTVNSFNDDERYRYDLAVASWGAHISTLETLMLIQAKHKMPPDDPDVSQEYLDEETGLAEIEEYVVSDLGKVLLTSIGE